jgi:Protein of unknown function (DUF1566)
MWAGLALGLALGSTFGTVAAQQRCETDPGQKSPPGERFHDNGDGTVTDTRLKLTWMRCAAGQVAAAGACTGDATRMDWAQAQAQAAQVNQRGTHFYSDWRLPQLRELATVIEARCSNPRINLTVFPATPPDFFWSATPRPGDDTQSRAYALSFGGEGVQILDRKEAHHVRLVRSAQ